MGFRPIPHWRSLQRSPDPELQGPTSKRREGEGAGGGRIVERRGR